MKRWRKVSMSEIDEALNQGIFAGCVHAFLVQRYGKGNIKHKPGYGFYKLV